MTLILSGTDGLSDIDGSAATPALRGTDANTGIFFPTADTTAISTGGTERMRIDSSGNLGLGITPSAWDSGFSMIQTGSNGSAFGGRSAANTAYMMSNSLRNGSAWKYINTAAAAQFQVENGTFYWFNAASGTAGNAITFTQAMTLNSSGNLGIGSTSPAMSLNGSTRALHVYQGTVNGAGLRLESSNANFELIAGDASVYMYSTGDDPIRFGTNNTERARITSGGDLLVGTDNAAENAGAGMKVLNTGGTVALVSTVSDSSQQGFEMYSSGAAAYRLYVNYAGTIHATNTTISAISDQRLKENIQDLDVGLNAVMALKPRKFDWKAGKGKDIKGDRGWIAQEFEQVFPDMIDTWRDPAPEGEEPYKAVRADLIPVLVKAIQEQQALITSLTSRIAALEAKE